MRIKPSNHNIVLLNGLSECTLDWSHYSVNRNHFIEYIPQKNLVYTNWSKLSLYSVIGTLLLLGTCRDGARKYSWGGREEIARNQI